MFEITKGPTHPGKVIKKMLESEGLTQKEFAYLVGRPAKTINQIINGKKSITAQTACDLELVLNIPAVWWLQKQAEYDLAIECQTYSNTLRVLPKKEKAEPLSKTNSMKTEILELQAKGKRHWDIAEVNRNIMFEFVLIQPGTFMMGSPEDEVGRFADEALHEVTITKPFYMQTTPVTQEQWEAIMGNNPSYYKGDNLPVEQVSWGDVQQFIQYLNQRDEGVYRLPTEAEWEYACRAGTHTPFSIGNGHDLDSLQANFNGNYPYGDGGRAEYRRQTTPVKSFRPNAWGLYDMHGNVWEWVQDWDDSYLEEGSVSGIYRVYRGGSWFNESRYARSANRGYGFPENRTRLIGFRLVKEVE